MTGWIGNVFIVVGLWRVGGKHLDSFVWSFIGEVIWIYHANQMEQYDLAAICTVFAGMAPLNFWKWKAGGSV